MPHPMVLEEKMANGDTNGDIVDAFVLNEDVIWVVHLQSIQKAYEWQFNEYMS